MISLVFAGDFYTKTAGFAICQDYLDMINNSTLFVLNIEGAITNSSNKAAKFGPNLQIPPDIIDSYFARFPNLLYSCANNHIGDFGHKGVQDSIKYFEDSGKSYCGIGTNAQSAKKPFLLEKNNHKIAILAVAENEFGMATKSQAGSNGFDPINNTNQINELNKQGYTVIVYFHGGTEYLPLPNPFIIRTFRGFIDAGAKLVVGSHTHCPLGYEEYKQGYIFYGIGNFIFNNTYTNKTLQSKIKQFIKSKVLQQKKDDLFWNYGHSVSITLSNNKLAFKIIPTYNKFNSLNLLDNNQQSRYLCYLDHISKIIDDSAEYDKYWSSWIYSRKRFIKHLLNFHKHTQSTNPVKYNKALGFSNLITCESHRELIISYAKTHSFNGLNKYLKELQLLQDPEYQL